MLDTLEQHYTIAGVCGLVGIAGATTAGAITPAAAGTDSSTPRSASAAYSYGRTAGTQKGSAADLSTDRL